MCGFCGFSPLPGHIKDIKIAASKNKAVRSKSKKRVGLNLINVR